MSEPPLVNKAGRPIWFVPHEGVEGGVYRAVTPEGRRAFTLTALWVLASGTAGMVAFALTFEPRCFVAMFVAGGAGLALFVRTVIRHS